MGRWKSTEKTVSTHGKCTLGTGKLGQRASVRIDPISEIFRCTYIFASSICLTFYDGLMPTLPSKIVSIALHYRPTTGTQIYVVYGPMWVYKQYGLFHEQTFLLPLLSNEIGATLRNHDNGSLRSRSNHRRDYTPIRNS